MTVRSKVWLVVALSAAATAVGAYVLRTWAMRSELLAQSRQAAREIWDDIAHALGGLGPEASDHEFAIVLHRYLDRHPRIQRLHLVVEGKSAIDYPRGEQPFVTRFTSRIREPLGYSRQETGEQVHAIQDVVDLNGPWKGSLSLQWRLGAVEQMIEATEKYSLILGGVHLVALVLILGLVIDRLVVRRLDRLTRAMRDVEGGDLERRVPVDANDEVGRLSRGFNQMLDRLSDADREIRAFNNRLAGEIEAATLDLSKKNVALAQLNRLLNDLRRENASKVRLATLGQLAAQLAHEIGTPLSSVSGHLQLALAQRDLPANLRERLDVATREIARIGRIVRDYLDSTRALEPENRPTSLSQVLGEARDVTRSVEVGRKRDIDVEIADDPADFVTDPGLLRQIVINLLANALDAVERGGQVTLAGGTEGEDVLITVRDTGTGIAAEDLRRIFEPFYTTKGRGKGTGLGLAICRELAAALGGSISVESEPGKGSTFTVRLPRRGAPLRGEPARPGAAVGAARGAA
jgi:signal transduction histidine kinase